jgi:hypothetical protein
MFKDREIRKGIISSIIASILVLIFFQPLLVFFWNILTEVSTTFYIGYVDNVAKSKRQTAKAFTSIVLAINLE